MRDISTVARTLNREEGTRFITTFTKLATELNQEFPITFLPILRSVLRDLWKVYQETEMEGTLKIMMEELSIILENSTISHLSSPALGMRKRAELSESGKLILRDTIVNKGLEKVSRKHLD